MNYKIENYNSASRVLIITESNNLMCDESGEKTLSVQDSQVTIGSDSHVYTLCGDLQRFTDEMNLGDIVVVSEDGRIHRLYNSQYVDEATVFISGQCNSNCIMCPCSDWERKTETGLSDENMEDYLELLPYSLRHIVITGGEPTIKTNQFFHVLEVLSQKCPDAEILLLTNGRSFSIKEMVNQLCLYRAKHMLIAIPLHGDSEELHDSITRAQHSFRQTIQGIKNLLSCGFDIEIRVVITQLNYHHITHIAQKILEDCPAVRIVNFIGLETLGNCAKNFRAVYLDHQSAFLAIKNAIDLLVRNGIDCGIYNFPLCSIDKGYWPIYKKSISEYKIRYPEQCSSCTMKSYCGGFFNSTLAVAKPQVFPFTASK